MNSASGIKLQQFVRLAEDVNLTVTKMADLASKRLLAQTEQMAFRDRVIAGLTAKALHCFLCLIEDAKQKRPEAFHHLKTLVETYFYFSWVGAKTTDERAKLLMAKACEARIRLFRNSRTAAELADVIIWEKGLEFWTKGIEREWKVFKGKRIEHVVTEGGISPEWYQSMYRLACEPAHISDFFEYIPRPIGPISLAKPITADMKAHIALDDGLQVLLALTKDLSEMYEFGFDAEISDLSARLDQVRLLDMKDSPTGQT